MHEEEQTEKDQREQYVSPNVGPQRIEVPELQTLVQVGEDLIVQILGRPSSNGGSADVLGVSHDVSISTPFKQRVHQTGVVARGRSKGWISSEA